MTERLKNSRQIVPFIFFKQSQDLGIIQTLKTISLFKDPDLSIFNYNFQ